MLWANQSKTLFDNCARQIHHFSFSPVQLSTRDALRPFSNCYFCFNCIISCFNAVFNSFASSMDGSCTCAIFDSWKRTSGWHIIETYAPFTRSDTYSIFVTEFGSKVDSLSIRRGWFITTYFPYFEMRAPLNVWLDHSEIISVGLCLKDFTSSFWRFMNFFVSRSNVSSVWRHVIPQTWGLVWAIIPVIYNRHWSYNAGFKFRLSEWCLL